MPARIGPRKPRRIYLVEWREHRGLTQERLAQRLGVSAMTVSRWERPNSQAQLNTSAMVAVAEALDIEPQDLWRHPDRPSADQLLRDASDLEARRAVAAIAAMLGKTGTDN